MSYYDSIKYTSSEEESFNRQQNIRARRIIDYNKNNDIDNEGYSFLDSKLFWFCLGCCFSNLRNE